MLNVKRHWKVEELLIVTDTELPDDGGTVVARYNEKHDELALTKHGKGRRAEVKAAIAGFQS